MEQEVSIIDVLKAFEPTGFSSGATVVLGALAIVFIVSLFSLFGYMLVNLILPIRKRADDRRQFYGGMPGAWSANHGARGRPD